MQAVTHFGADGALRHGARITSDGTRAGETLAASIMSVVAAAD